MGHLINSNALRLGWFLNWSDSWYHDHTYYAEFLYNVIRVRFFLLYFFSLKNLEKAGYFYSHFEIIQKYNYLKVNIFIYDGWIEALIEELVFLHRSEIKLLNKNPAKQKPSSYYKPWKFLSILGLMNKSFLYCWSPARIRYLIKTLNTFNKKILISFILNNKAFYHLRGSASRIIFFFTLFIKIKSLISKNYIKAYAPYNLVLSRFLYIISWSGWNKSLFFAIKGFLSFTLNLLVSSDRLFINFFAITNYAVNSKFLSRYLGKKLKQNYSVSELLDPVKRELRMIVSKARYSLSNYFFYLTKDKHQKDLAIKYKRGVLKHVFYFY